MKKLICIVLIFTLTACCGCVDVSLSDAFDETEVSAAAEHVVELINARDYEGIEALVREDLRDVLSAEVLADVLDEVLDQYGMFVNYKAVTVVGQKVSDTGEEYAVAVLSCAYEQGKLKYTLSFDSELALAGLYVR